MPVSTERKKVTDLPAAATLTPAMMLYIVDPAEAAVVNQSKRASIALFDARYVGIAGAVTSVFGRIGAVVAIAGDYLASQITNVPAGGIAAVTVQAAIDELDTEKQAADAFLSSIALLGTAADRMIYTTGVDTAAETALTAYARTLLDDANAVTARATLGAAAAGVADATFITQTPSAELANEQALSALGTGLVKNTTGTGVLSIASAGVDYSLLPVDDDTALVYRTGFPARTVTLDATALTAARVVTVPDAAFTLAGLQIANVFTAVQKINVNSATALLVEQDGVKDNVLVVDTANGRVGVGITPSYPLEVFSPNTNIMWVTGPGYKRVKIASLDDDVELSLAGAAGKDVQIEFLQGGIVVGSFKINNNDFYFINRVASDSANIYFRTRGGSDRMIITGAGQVGVGSNSPSAQLHIITEDAVTAAITNVAILGHNSTGTPAANFGTGLLLQGESSTTANQNMARIAALWNVATHASRAAGLVAYASDFNAEREIWRGRADGTNPMFAVLGQTPAARQAHIIDADGTLADVTAKFNTLLSYLETFGFIATV